MSAKITLYDGTVYSVSSEEADQVNRAIREERAFIVIGGSTVAVSAIQHFDSTDRPPLDNPALPRGEYKPTNWKFDKDKKQFAKSKRMDGDE